MNQTARNIIYNCARVLIIGITNYLDFIETYEFFLNGALIYYLNRSQPPMFSEMILEYYKTTQDFEIIIEMLPILLKEYQYWSEKHSVKINGHTLSRYFVKTKTPRPESFLEDTKEGLYQHTS